MNKTPLWRALLLMACVLLACNFTNGGSYLPPTETPRAVADNDNEQDQEDQDNEQDENDNELDLDNNDLDIGGLGDRGNDNENDNADQDNENDNEDRNDNEDNDNEDENENDNEDNDNEDENENDNGNGRGDACTPFEASSDAFWVTLDEDFNIVDEVDEYPSGTTLITPVFEYDCAPNNVDVVSVFSYEGEVVYSDEESIQPSTGPGIYGYPLGTTDNSALSDGRYGIEFYVDDELIADGEVEVGGSGSDGGDSLSSRDLVTVEGQVTSASSGRAIKKALIIFLVPGVTVQDWVDANYPDNMVHTSTESDSRGEFTMPKPLERNVEYSLVVLADGYRPVAQDGMVITDDLEPPVFLTVELAEA